jgi:streptomycin 6-kinase
MRSAVALRAGLYVCYPARMSAFIEIPATFLAMPRWWHEGEAWLAALPAIAESMCRRWRLIPDGKPMHGSNALVLPVRRDGEALALRLAPPDDRTTAEIAALRFWDGRGTAHLIDADPAIGASLLERLDAERSLARLPLADAIPIIARLLRRLAVPIPEAMRPAIPSTGDLVRERLADLPGEWERLGRPFPRAVLNAALTAGEQLREPEADVAVNGDLHVDQVLGGAREPWLAVDPVLLRGDVAYDLARILWTRLDEMGTDDEVRRWFGVIIDVAALDPNRALHWVVFRAIDYWLWGLGYGLTEDPVRCARLVRVFADMQ